MTIVRVGKFKHLGSLQTGIFERFKKSRIKRTRNLTQLKWDTQRISFHQRFQTKTPPLISKTTFLIFSKRTLLQKENLNLQHESTLKIFPKTRILKSAQHQKFPTNSTSQTSLTVWNLGPRSLTSWKNLTWL